MALPRVTPGTYNYGAYANPTPIKYKGGLGEGLAGLMQAGGQVIKAKKDQEKAEDEKAKKDAAALNKIKMDALDSQLKYKNALYKANPNPSEQTQNSYNELADLMYKTELGLRTNSIDFNEGSNMKTKLNNVLNISQSVTEWVKDKAKSDLPSITKIRESDKDFKLWSRDKALTTGNFGVSYDEDYNPYIEYYEVDFDKYMSSSYKNVDDIPMKKASMKMSDIFDDKNLYQPDVKYSWETDEASINKYAADLTKNAKAFATGARNGYKYLTDNDINRWKTTLINDFSTDIINTRGKQIYEDVLVDENGERYGYGSWQGTAEQINEVKEAFTNKILEKIPRVYDKLSKDEEGAVVKQFGPEKIDKLKKLAIDILPHDKQAATIDMNKIVSGLQEFGLTIEEKPNMPGYQIRSGGQKEMFTIAPNSSAQKNLISITNALGIPPIDITEDMEFSLYKRK